MTTGGGSQTSIPLTADLVARAIIAAARAYGDDPVISVTSISTQKRRALSPALSGLNYALDIPLDRLCAIFGMKKSSIHVARAPSVRKPAFTAAEQAAMAAAGGAAPEPAPPSPEPPLRIPVEFDEPQLPAAPAAPADARIDVEPGGCAPPVQVGPAKRGPAGPVSSWLQMPQPVRTEALGSERLLADLVFEALAGGPLNSMSLSTLIDRKEMAVSSALNQLAHLGLVAPEPCETGPRKLVWRRIDSQEAAA
jgi:hypothetical protein